MSLESNPDNATLQKEALLIKEYSAHAAGLGAIAESGAFARLEGSFLDYPRYLKSRFHKLSSKRLLMQISAGSPVIGVNNASPELREIFYLAHIAVCCELFKDVSIPAEALNQAGMRAVCDNIVKLFLKDGTSLLQGTQRLQFADAMRTMQILRLLGLVTLSTPSARQLSFACGNADREIYGVHSTPRIYRETGAGGLAFSTQWKAPQHIALIDNAPQFKNHFDMLNSSHRDWLYAMNKGLNEALAELGGKINNTGHSFRPRNLVAGLRIDHLMFPDVAAFFASIAPLLQPASDLVITVGAGHTLEEFEGRINKIKEMSNYLSGLGLEPVRIKLYTGDTLQERRSGPNFGVLAYTTYEILYCRLRRRLLPGGKGI
ncbi:MAG TPA: hypothetical protein ENI62_11670 [Gammaproteobacteria bacterium]|nr:hypothetical protein [Gammaproteobacteria bacterium]